jgi:hypothetical protein
MNPHIVALAVVTCVFGAVLLGMRLRAALPAHHLSDETKDAVRIGMGLVATMAALILGLLVASAKGSYDTEKSEVTQMAAKIAFLDRVLVNYGPEAQPARQMLRQAVEGAIVRIWSEAPSGTGPADPSSAWSEALPKAIQKLSPQDDAQRVFKAQAAAVTADLGQLRLLLFEQAGTSISQPLLIVVIVWLAIIFGSVGLFAPWNSTVVIALMLAALSVSGAIFLILELDQPFGGVIQISSASMRNALEHLGR